MCPPYLLGCERTDGASPSASERFCAPSSSSAAVAVEVSASALILMFLMLDMLSGCGECVRVIIEEDSRPDRRKEKAREKRG